MDGQKADFGVSRRQRLFSPPARTHIRCYGTYGFVRAKRARAAGCPQRFARCVAMWCDAQRRVVERCDAPRRVALPTVTSISPTHLIDYAKTWRGREATSRQRCCRIVFIFVSASMTSPSLPSLPTIMPRPANRPCANASPLDAHCPCRKLNLTSS